MNVNKKSIKSDLARIDAMTDSDIDYSDSPELVDEFFEKTLSFGRLQKNSSLSSLMRMCWNRLRNKAKGIF
jgi:hypothetical protein